MLQADEVMVGALASLMGHFVFITMSGIHGIVTMKKTVKGFLAILLVVVENVQKQRSKSKMKLSVIVSN